MYERYMVDPKDIKNVIKDGVAIGFNVKVKIPYYRGVFLSLVEIAHVRFDNTLFTENEMTFTVRGNTYTFKEMETMSTLRWEFGEKATLFVPLKGGIPLGTHRVETSIGIRVSYMGGARPVTNVCYVSDMTPLKIPC